MRIPGRSYADTRQKLNALDSSFAEYRKAVGGILGNMQKLIIAKQAGSQIFRDSEELLDATYQLAQAYHGSFMQRTAYGMALLILILLAISLVFLLGKTYLAESQRQTEQAEQRRQETELLNRQNQDAILRLMNELGDLAEATSPTAT